MSETKYSYNSSIAVVGVSALFPGSTDASGFWRDILAGTDLLTDVPPTHWLLEDYYDPDPSARDKTYARRGGFLSNVEFDPMEFGVPPNIIPATDTSQLLALIVAQKVLEDACGGQFSKLPRDRVSVVLGVTSAQELLATMANRLQRPVWVKAMRECGLVEQEVQRICDGIASQYVEWQESSFPGLLGNVVAGRIANRFDLHGTNCITDAACASALSAVHLAVNELRIGESDLVITGGVDTMNDIFMYMCFSKTPALSKSGDCRPFSDQADGTMLGEGLAMVALKRLDDAERDSDRIYAVIRGVGSSSDGRAKSVYAPVPEGQALALTRAYERAGYGPDTVELVEAHGTGTAAGDLAEFSGLQMVFDGSGRRDRQWCALGSVKSQIGHTKATAGAAGLFKAVMALHHKALPPTIKIERPNPELNVGNSPFYLNTMARPWIRDSRHPRRASVSSFGFGGSNFHVALEEYTGKGSRAYRLRTAPTELVLLSDSNAANLIQQCRETAARVETSASFTDVARQSQTLFGADAEFRLALVASDGADLAQKLLQAAHMIEQQPARPFSTPTGTHYNTGVRDGSVAFMFPGQGSQYVGMGGDLALFFDEAREVWDDAAAIPLAHDGQLQEVVFPRPVFSDSERTLQKQRLTTTEWAQPAIAATSLSILGLMTKLGVKPECVGGHSFGEITALHAAGAFTARDLLLIARQRGELMAVASDTPGAMTAVSLPLNELKERLREWRCDVVIANHNTPTEIVLSGTVDAIHVVEQRLASSGISFHRLDVATAFHSPLVSGSSVPFLKYLESINLCAPRIDVYSNTEAALYPLDPSQIRARIAEQIAKPVRFAEEIEAMYARGVRIFVEVGPGSVLTKLISQCLADRPHIAVNLDRKGRHGLTALWEGLGRLAVAGVAQSFDELWTAFAPVSAQVTERDSATHKKPRLMLSLNGSNYGKPYPPPGGAVELPAAKLSPGGKMSDEDVAHVSAAQDASQQVVQPPDVFLTSNGIASQAQATTPLMAQGNGSHPHGSQGNGSNGNGTSAVPDWLEAFQEIQRQTAETHAAYGRAMVETHAEFLRNAENTMRCLTTLLTGQPLPLSVPFDTPTETLSLEAATPSLDEWREATPITSPVEAVMDETASHSAGAAMTEAHTDAPAPVPAPASSDLSGLLLGVVAEKTGYPVEMLELQMELEADLGIDSIKRVEILSALRSVAPELPEVQAAEMAQLRTLGQIIDRMTPSGLSPDVNSRTPASVLAEPAEAHPRAAATSQPTAAPVLDLSGLLLNVVAEKTGYPVEMLELHMELEADLGIDSIKRVEILSALRTRAPELPEVQAGEMAQLRTLGQIIDRMATSGLSPDVNSSVSTMPAPPSATPGAEIISTATEPERVLGRYALRRVAAPAVGFAMTHLADGHVVISDEGTGVAQRLVQKLKACGVDARVGEPGDKEVGGFIFLGGLREVSDVDAALAVNREAFRAAKVVARHFTENGGLFVTVQDTGGDFGLSGNEPDARCWLSGLSGLAKTAAQEWPRSSVKAIDLQRAGRSAEELADALCAELTGGGPELEVGLDAEGHRITLESYTAQAIEHEPTINETSVLVVSGGGHGVTSATILALARASRARFLLLGRTPLEVEPEICNSAESDAELSQILLGLAKADGQTPTPAKLRARVRRVRANREIKATLEALRAVGSEAHYAAVDVRDRRAVSKALAETRERWGPLTGLVHGAGVLADKLITDKQEEEFSLVFDTKIEGLRSLLEASAEDPLRLICLFSSVAARTGNAGQCDYAMANEILNKVAAVEDRRRDGSCVVKSINWTPWEGGMVTPLLKARFEELGVPLISSEEGGRLFLDEVQTKNDKQIEVVLGAPPRPHALLAESANFDRSFDVHLHRSSHPYLGSHRIKGITVLPVVMVLELFAQAAKSARHDLNVSRCRNLKVLRGIQLPNFDGNGDWLRVHCRQVSNGNGATLALELRHGDEPPNYCAQVDMDFVPLAAPAAVTLPAGAESFEGWPHETIYGGVLFHDRDLQVIRSVEGVSEKGITATLAGIQELGWSGGPWETDVAAFDGALQVAVLWTRHMLNGVSLPTAVAEYRSYDSKLPEGRISCFLQGQVCSPERALSDIVLLDDGAHPFAELKGVETHILPGANPDPTINGRPWFAA